MSIESRISTGELNIKDLQIETPETDDSDFVFDPTRDISAKIKAEMLAKNEVQPISVDIIHLANTKFLFPEEFNRIDPIIKEQESRIERWARLIKMKINDGDATMALIWASALKMLYPKADLDKKYFDDFFEDLSEPPANASPTDIDTWATKLKIVYPEKADKAIKDLGMSNRTVDILQIIRQIQGDNDSVELLIDCLYTLRITQPEKFKQIKLTRQDWRGGNGRRGFIKWLNESLLPQTKSVLKYGEYAARLYVIAADEVHLTKDDFAVVNKTKNIEQKTTNLPEVKKF